MIAALILSAFAFTATVDRFTDATTFAARSGDADRGPLVEVICGPASDFTPAVIVSTGRAMYVPAVPLVARYPERVRFDDLPMAEVGFRYDRGDRAVLTGEDAQLFIAGMKAAARVSLEVADYDGDKVQLDVPLAGAAEAIARVEQSCRP